MPSGYSGSPLGKKLGLKDGFRVSSQGMPEDVLAEIESYGAATIAAFVDLDLMHVFVTERAYLAERVVAGRHLIRPAGMIWASWPKKASKVATDITEDTIREIALPLGLVDVKVCAVNEVWSGLKLVIRKELR